MIIIQNKSQRVLSIHTTIPAFCRHYEILGKGKEKRIREDLNKAAGNTVEYKNYIITKKYPI